mmetsp:Transcript_12091/g.24315  ORF Transcript_12091/g.24315 Transcript_12091/m.24315 type:complete len:219 (+) Transcript_12091:1209-1865(+)
MQTPAPSRSARPTLIGRLRWLERSCGPCGTCSRLFAGMERGASGSPGWRGTTFSGGFRLCGANIVGRRRRRLGIRCLARSFSRSLRWLGDSGHASVVRFSSPRPTASPTLTRSTLARRQALRALPFLRSSLSWSGSMISRLFVAQRVEVHRASRVLSADVVRALPYASLEAATLFVDIDSSEVVLRCSSRGAMAGRAGSGGPSAVLASVDPPPPLQTP